MKKIDDAAGSRNPHNASRCYAPNAESRRRAKLEPAVSPKPAVPAEIGTVFLNEDGTLLRGWLNRAEIAGLIDRTQSRGGLLAFRIFRRPAGLASEPSR